MKELGWIFGIGIAVMFCLWLVFPTEQMGAISKITCGEEIQTEPYSPATYLKTFTCENSLDSLYCVNRKYSGGTCTKEVYYFRKLGAQGN